MKRVPIIELVGWELDEYEYRPPIVEERLTDARMLVERRSTIIETDPVLSSGTGGLKHLLEYHSRRADLLEEMAGLVWTMGIVDITLLIAFQRRLFFPSDIATLPAPAADDWAALVAHSFGPTKSPEFYSSHEKSKGTITLRSANPNLHFRTTSDPRYPLTVHTGSPFFEVGSLYGRWFLRDGYHRAFALLQAGVRHVPAVIVHATSIEELGANQPWFFPEKILFSSTPPLVADFLDSELTIEYDRPSFIKTLRLTIEDDLAPDINIGE
jgi:hypothetical protein